MQVVQLESGRWRGSYQIQDGVEYHESDTLEVAIAGVINGVRVMNNTTIQRTDVEVYRLKTVVTTVLVRDVAVVSRHPCS